MHRRAFSACLTALVFCLPTLGQDLKSIPGQGESTEPKNLLKPTNKLDTWRFEEHEGGQGAMAVDGDAIAFTISYVTGTDWHVQAVQTDLDLKDGQQYTLQLEIKASGRRPVMVNAMIDEEDWHTIGLQEEMYVGTDFKKHEFTFRADGVASNKKNRISLVLGAEKGTVWVKNMKLIEKAPRR